MQVNFNPSVNQSPNFKACFDKDYRTEEAFNKLIRWSPEKTLVVNYIIKDNIKGNDEIFVCYDSFRGQYYVRNNTTDSHFAFDHDAHRWYEDPNVTTPVDVIIRHLKHELECESRYGFHTTNEKCVHIDEKTEATYYTKAKNFVAKLAPKQDRVIDKLKQKKQILEEQLRTLNEKLYNIEEERLKIVTEGIQKEIYKVAKKVK